VHPAAAAKKGVVLVLQDEALVPAAAVKEE
jgi:hypothetical protein